MLQVYSDGHLYLNDVEAREEGGTPAIIESIRAALAFKIKHVSNIKKYNMVFMYKVCVADSTKIVNWCVQL